VNRYTALLEALEPISHGDTLTGVDNATNTRLFMRSGGFVGGSPYRIPDVSENALRSVVFRYPLHDHLLARLEVGRASLPQSVVNLLFSGGNMAKGATAPGDEMALGHEVKRLYPSLDLLGGAVDSFILPKSRLKLAAWPVAREYAFALRHVAPDLVDEAERVSVFDLLSEETRTRGTGDDSEGNQMLYTYEVLAAGTRVLMEATLDAHAPEATRSALGLALARWDGYFGGQGRQGRGRMGTVRHDFSAPDAYLTHLDAHAEAMHDGLVSGQLGTRKVLCAS
jgi:hypothetical protein